MWVTEQRCARAQVRLGVPVSDVYVVTSHCGTMLGRMMAATTPSPLLVTTPDRIDTITTALAAHTAGVAPLAGIAITDHSGVPSPFRSALRAIFEGLDRTHRARAGDSKQYSLPIFITALDTYHANKVRRTRTSLPCHIPDVLSMETIRVIHHSTCAVSPLLVSGCSW